MTLNRSAPKRVPDQEGEPPPSPPHGEAACSPTDDDRGSIGEQYLRLFGEPALAKDSDTYQRVYQAVRSILRESPITHVHTAYKAAWDAAVMQAEIYFSGGQRDE